MILAIITHLMKSKNLLYLITGFAIFLILVYFNYTRAQEAIKQTRPSLLSVDLVTFPETVKAGNLGTFVWEINASPDLSTRFTNIYWGYISTPSALLKTDSPQAVGYLYSQPDYGSGSFSLPGSFDLRIPFAQPGRVYFRAYAKVGDNHLWTEEKSLVVVK